MLAFVGFMGTVLSSSPTVSIRTYRVILFFITFKCCRTPFDDVCKKQLLTKFSSPITPWQSKKKLFSQLTASKYRQNSVMGILFII